LSSAASGYSAFWKKYVHVIRFTGDDYEGEALINSRIMKASFKVMELPCEYDARIAGKTKSPAFRQA
jgi:hypothetical protein